MRNHAFSSATSGMGLMGQQPAFTGVPVLQRAPGALGCPEHRNTRLAPPRFTARSASGNALTANAPQAWRQPRVAIRRTAVCRPLRQRNAVRAVAVIMNAGLQVSSPAFCIPLTPRSLFVMDSNDKITRSSLHVEVTDRLREMIYERQLAPGERIDELGLSARLGTSRTPLREALKVLAHEGLVKLVPGRGAFVIELSDAEIDALFPVLGVLQSRCAGDAVRNHQPEDLIELDQAEQQIEQAVTGNHVASYHRAVDRFHAQLQRMAANPWLTRSITDLRRFLQLSRSRMPTQENRLRQSMAEYRTLMKAIKRGDAEGAEHLVYLQATAQQRAWRSWMNQQAKGAAEGAASETTPALQADPQPSAGIPAPHTPATSPSAHVRQPQV